MPRLAREWVRADELQTISILENDEGGFYVIEAVELWEAPHDEAASFCWYPVVLGGEIFTTLEAAEDRMAAAYPWVRDNE